MTTRDAKKLWFLFSCPGCSYNPLHSARTQNRCFSKTKLKKKPTFLSFFVTLLAGGTTGLLYIWTLLEGHTDRFYVTRNMSTREDFRRPFENLSGGSVGGPSSVYFI